MDIRRLEKYFRRDFYWNDNHSVEVDMVSEMKKQEKISDIA